MTYWWTQIVADIADWFPGGLAGLGIAMLLIGVAIGIAVQPSGVFKFNRRQRKVKVAPIDAVVVAETNKEELPQLPSATLLARAQQFMAAGDYRSAVREWLRLMVRRLVEQGVIENHPGWTVTELAAAAGIALPWSAGILNEAARIFSDVWYGEVPADISTGTRMRDIQSELDTTAELHPDTDRSVEAT